VRVLVISDVHANYTALQAVLADAGQVDEVWCLGDIVGYGPDPNRCIQRIRELPNLTCLLGNHDVALLGAMPLYSFNGEARLALEWQEGVLTASNLAFLRSLPERLQVRGQVSLVHGSPRDPVWEYVVNTLSARLNFDFFETPWCVVGHSHTQCIFQLEQERNRISLDIPHLGETLKLKPRAILNPGSVGQPRDRDPRAAYAIYDTEAETWEPRRVEYDIAEVQQRIRKAGLPEKHAVRLAYGW
jgi:diadenosine tetraphosphatase ApaH/serine/threonine PP2A family protein phosphatase